MEKNLLHISLSIAFVICFNSMAISQELTRWDESTVNQTDYQALLDRNLSQYSNRDKVAQEVKTTTAPNDYKAYEKNLNNDIVSSGKNNSQIKNLEPEYKPVTYVAPNQPMVIIEAPTMVVAAIPAISTKHSIPVEVARTKQSVSLE